jgi:hypothetical protein
MIHGDFDLVVGILVKDDDTSHKYFIPILGIGFSLQSS